MSTHPAVVTVAVGAPLEIHNVATIPPKDNEVLVHVEWTASTPLDVHQALGGLLVTHPQRLGDGFAGTVIARGPTARYAIGDKVFGFTWRSNTEKAHQLYLTAPDNLMGILPTGFSMQDAVSVPNNFVTAWHTLTHELGLALPWPKPASYTPPAAEAGAYILLWGGSSSVGQYLLQILKWYGYTHILTTASRAHHAKLTRYGAEKCFDYRDPDVKAAITSYLASQPGTPKLRHLVDAIGHLRGSVQPLSQLAPLGSQVTIMLPVTLVDASTTSPPIYTLDVAAIPETKWFKDVRVTGVRTHFYLDNSVLAERLQSEIMPAALTEGVVEPNEVRIVEGDSLLERACMALELLRQREVSGARLVWRVAEAP
jgi:NADPH:quinone reductase-like Zn-dependent oxidoreductase